MGFSPFRALSTTVLGSVPRVDTRGRLEASCHAHRRAPSHRGCIPRSGLRRLSSRAQDPSTRRVSRTPRITVRQRPSSPSASRALGTPAASPIPRLAGVFGRSVLPVPPLGGTPRLPALGGRLPRRGHGRWTSKTLFRRTAHQSYPLRGRLATEPLAELGLVPRHRVDPDTADFRQSHRLCDPLLREEQIGGGPACRQVGRLSWDFVPCRLGSKVRALRAVLVYSPFGSSPFGPEGPYGRFTSGETPRRRDAVDPDPSTTRAVEDTVPALSRARRAFARRGVLRVASFR